MPLALRLSIISLLLSLTLQVLQLDAAVSTSSPIGSVAVFTAGESGYACFRIPSLLRLPTGEIAMYAEARKFSCDDHGHIDLVFRISADNGTLWGLIQLLHSESGSGARVTIGNPAPVVVNGRVLLAFTRNNKQVATLLSADAAGRNWPATPTEITQMAFGTDSLLWVQPCVLYS